MQTIYLNTTEAISKASKIICPTNIRVHHSHASNMRDTLFMESATRFKVAEKDPRKFDKGVSIHLDVYIPLSQQITHHTKTDDAIKVGLRFFCSGIANSYHEKFSALPEAFLKAIAKWSRVVWFCEHAWWGYGYCINWKKAGGKPGVLFFQLDWEGRNGLIASENYQFCKPLPTSEVKLLERLKI